jgi:hypothetical protein
MLLAWNLNHFNNDYNDAILNGMANIMRPFSVIVLTEVSKDAPLNKLEKLLSDHKATRLIKMDAKKGFYGVFLYNKDEVTLIEECAITGINTRRQPIAAYFEWKRKSWKFWVVGLHLVPG